MQRTLWRSAFKRKRNIVFVLWETYACFFLPFLGQGLLDMSAGAEWEYSPERYMEVPGENRLSLCLSVSVSLSLPLSVSLSLSVCLSVCVCVCVSVPVSVCLSVYLSACLSLSFVKLFKISVSVHSINQMEWLTIPAWPSLICFKNQFLSIFSRGETERTIEKGVKGVDEDSWWVGGWGVGGDMNSLWKVCSAL